MTPYLLSLKKNQHLLLFQCSCYAFRLAMIPRNFSDIWEVVKVQGGCQETGCHSALRSEHYLPTEPDLQTVPHPGREVYGRAVSSHFLSIDGTELIWWNSLRTAPDATAVGWPGYDFQKRNYLNSTVAHKLSLIYLSSGNPVDAIRFTTEAASLGINVTTKDILLTSSEKFAPAVEELEALSWDQRGIIDYLVLLGSSYFVGMFESSFTWNVANRRHVVVGNGAWRGVDGTNQGGGKRIKGQTEGHEECFWDKLSAVYGPVDMIGLRWQFPWGLYP
jgi:hypothetical protein